MNDFTYGCGMPSVAPVAVRRLNKDGCFREALSIHLAPDVVEPHAFADVTTGLLDHTITVHVGEKPQTESVKKRLHHQDWFKQQFYRDLSTGEGLWSRHTTLFPSP